MARFWYKFQTATHCVSYRSCSKHKAQSCIISNPNFHTCFINKTINFLSKTCLWVSRKWNNHGVQSNLGIIIGDNSYWTVSYLSEAVSFLCTVHVLRFLGCLLCWLLCRSSDFGTSKKKQSLFEWSLFLGCKDDNFCQCFIDDALRNSRER